MMTKRNASEYIKGSIRIYRDTHARYCRGRAKLRWACRSSVVHSTKVGRLSWLSPRRSVSCIRVALQGLLRPAFNIPMCYTDTRDAYVCA